MPASYYEIEIGKARHVQEGSDLSIITYGAAVHWALDFAGKHPTRPLIFSTCAACFADYEAIRSSAMRTGKILVLHEDTLTGGTGAEIAARISEHCFQYLDVPVMRCASLDTLIPLISTKRILWRIRGWTKR